MTAAAVLVVALVGGAAGGAMVMGNGSEPVDPRPVQMGLKVADEATTAPSPEVSPEPTMVAAPTPTPVVVPAAPGAEEEPVVSPKTESANEAADRAAREADRAERAADEAKEAADKAAQPAPVATPAPPVATPEPTPALPGYQTREGDPCPGYEGNSIKAGNGPLLKCEGGVWRKVDEPPPTPTPTPEP